MGDSTHDSGTGFVDLVGAGSPEAEGGSVRLELDVDERHLNPAGTVHGGMLATLVDTAMGAAVRSTTEDQVPATSQLTVTYLRPGGPGRLVVTAEVRKRGQDLTVCEAGVEQDGKDLVHAVATFALLSR
ncbi:PaaI family thioesterase [Nocardioides sp. SOB77]|uniref:PaaI family thioesterase n=1 Tax=Nocardioides oceani TaxID=3058369 RepID=A0ABT8FIA0_9ACTN|nr:PaaI family thioesterase [Nocardioides oceani]MDN4174264.1 PaaI family thioesterase [Nocardioides oceani]